MQRKSKHAKMMLVNARGSKPRKNEQKPVIIHVEKYTRLPSDIYLLERIYKEGEVDRNTNEASASSDQVIVIGRTYRLLALITPLSRSFAFAEAILAVVLLVLALTIVIVLVLVGIPVTLHLWGLWCRLLIITQSS